MATQLGLYLGQRVALSDKNIYHNDSVRIKQTFINLNCHNPTETFQI